jgi:hypothetical protein
MNSNEIKRIEAGLLNDYLMTLPYGQRKYFMYEVVKKCGNGVSVKTFYNWKYMACRIPYFAKKAMEDVAGKTIFIWDDKFVY